MIKGQDIICISASDWERPWGSKQQLMQRLSSGNRILYVEYQASFLHFCSPVFLFSRINKMFNPIRKIDKNLFIFTPYPYLPFGYYFRRVNMINQKILTWALKRAARRLNFKKPILWIYPPCAVDLLNRLDEKLIIYHCAADFPNEKRHHLRNRTICSMEKELVEKSDIVLALTESLYKRHKKINLDTHLFPSAVDGSLFSSFLDADTSEPKDMACLKKPRIGMVGYLDGRVLDAGLLCHIADSHPEWSLVLIGPKFRYARRFNPLIKKRNVHFLSEKKRSEIPLYIKGLDVCIIPYVTNEFTNNVSPLKLYEYLALGKPVVSTGLEDLGRFKDVVRLSADREDFVRNISLSLGEKDERLVNKRFDFAKENSWDERLAAVSKFMEGKL